MPERDLSWSEYIRRNHSSYGNSFFSSFVKHFEDACKKERNLSDRFHLAAKKVMWVLTTNIRKLRDEATRALYYYARKYPKEFFEHTERVKFAGRIWRVPSKPERFCEITYGKQWQIPRPEASYILKTKKEVED